MMRGNTEWPILARRFPIERDSRLLSPIDYYTVVYIELTSLGGAVVHQYILL